MACRGGGLHHLVTWLQGWFLSKAMFSKTPKPPTTMPMNPLLPTSKRRRKRSGGSS